MKADRKRDEEIRAFLRYARLGLASDVKALDQLLRIRGACSDEVALDMLAVRDTMRMLAVLGRKEVISAVVKVYFCAPSVRIYTNEMSYRVRRAADELHCDERTLYRWLFEARTLWRRFRELKHPF